MLWIRLNKIVVNIFTSIKNLLLRPTSRFQNKRLRFLQFLTNQDFHRSLLWFIFSLLIAYVIFELTRNGTPLWILFLEGKEFDNPSNYFQSFFVILVSLMFASFLDALLRKSKPLPDIIIVLNGLFSVLFLTILNQAGVYALNTPEPIFNIFENGLYEFILICLAIQMLVAKTVSYRSDSNLSDYSNQIDKLSKQDKLVLLK